MKRIFILINSALLLIAGAITAGNISGNDGLVTQIQKEVSYPDFLKGKVDVRISFQVKEDGSVELIDINTGDLRLKEYVITSLGALHFKKGTYTSGTVYSMNLSFKIV
jgi:hypothetical protein